MNIRQLKFKPIQPDQPSPSKLTKIECDGPELLAVLAKINAEGNRVTSMTIKGTAHYILNVQQSSDL